MIWTISKIASLLEQSNDFFEKYNDILDSQCDVVEFNSKNIVNGAVFIALSLGKGDGHDYVSDAFKNGASCAIVNKRILEQKYSKDQFSDKCLIYVEDCFDALKILALYKRNKSKAEFIAVTGSMGKTTTKEALHHVISYFDKCFVSRKNFNNMLGVLLNLASMPDDMKYAVIEVGMNHKGEIKEIIKLVKPDIAIITNIAENHISFFDSVLDIADAKCEIYSGLEKDGIAILNAEMENDIDGKIYDRCIDNLNNLSIKNLLTFGRENISESYVSKIEYLSNKEILCSYNIKNDNDIYQTIKVNFSNIPDYIIKNFAICMLVAKIYNFDLEIIAKKLQNFKLPLGRGNVIDINYQNIKFEIICDYYNAGPQSVKSALKYFSSLSQTNKIVILGDMGELGDKSVDYHLELLNYLLDSNIKCLILVGEFVKEIYNVIIAKSFSINVKIFDNVDILIDELDNIIKDFVIDNSEDVTKKVADFNISDALMLIKGSRSNSLEKIVQYLGYKKDVL